MSKKKATSSDVAKRAGAGSQRIRLSSSWTKEQKRKPEREADRCFLPYAYKPVLCIASAGD